MTPDQIAQKCADVMWENDDASRWLGMRLTEVRAGQATLTMLVEKHHTNGHNICHGGFIFTLADSAFAFACNSYNQAVVAQQNAITYIAPAALGATLTARATEVSKTGRSGIYDVCVTRDDGTVIAEFRGNSRTIKGKHYEAET